MCAQRRRQKQHKQRNNATMAMASEDDADFGGGGNEQWSFDDSLDGLEDSLDANDGEGQPKSTHTTGSST